MEKFTLSLNGPSLKIPSDISKASFDYVSRYQLIAEIINHYFDGKPKGHSVLDVGGLGSLLEALLPETPLTIFDSETEDVSKSQQKGDGAHMKSIKSGSYDAVVTSDTLEHIPQKDRKSFIDELVRASNDLIVLCAPFGDHGAAKEEAALQEFYVHANGTGHRWLEEHKEFQLPKEKEIVKYFEANDVSAVVINHSSIKLWRPLLSINLLSGAMQSPDVDRRISEINRFYNQKLMFNDFTPDSYRTFIVASKRKKITYEAPSRQIPADDYVQLLRLVTDFYSEVFGHHETVPVIRELVDSNTELTNKVTQLDTEKTNIINSKTWRYTEPLRGVVKQARRSK